MIGDYSIIDNLMNEIICFINKQEEAFFKEYLANAIPPIKGEITKGKLTWRGIRIHQYHNGDKQLFQRDKELSPIFPNNLYKIDYTS